MKAQVRKTVRDADGRRLTQKEVEASFASSYVEYQYHLVNFLADHLADVSRAFAGDMQKAMILAIIGQVHLNMMMANTATGRNAQDQPPDRRGITTNRLSDTTGIPRETTRRKLIEMEKSGWLVRHDGYWALAMDGPDAVARHGLSDLDTRAVKRVATFFRALSGLVGGGKV